MLFNRCDYCKNRFYCFHNKIVFDGKLYKLHYHCVADFKSRNREDQYKRLAEEMKKPFSY